MSIDVFESVALATIKWVRESGYSMMVQYLPDLPVPVLV